MLKLTNDYVTHKWVFVFGGDVDNIVSFFTKSGKELSFFATKEAAIGFIGRKGFNVLPDGTVEHITPVINVLPKVTQVPLKIAA